MASVVEESENSAVDYSTNVFSVISPEHLGHLAASDSRPRIEIFGNYSCQCPRRWVVSIDRCNTVPERRWWSVCVRNDGRNRVRRREVKITLSRTQDAGCCQAGRGQKHDQDQQPRYSREKQRPITLDSSHSLFRKGQLPYWCWWNLRDRSISTKVQLPTK